VEVVTSLKGRKNGSRFKFGLLLESAIFWLKTSNMTSSYIIEGRPTLTNILPPGQLYDNATTNIPRSFANIYEIDAILCLTESALMEPSFTEVFDCKIPMISKTHRARRNPPWSCSQMPVDVNKQERRGQTLRASSLLSRCGVPFVGGSKHINCERRRSLSSTIRAKWLGRTV